MNKQKDGYFRNSALALFAITSASIANVTDNRSKAETGQRISTIQHMVGKVKSEARSFSLFKDSDVLIHLICDTPTEDISDQDIDSLISFVRESDYEAAATGAEALASVGPKASRAIPVLEEALQKARVHEASMGPMTGILSTDVIKRALGIVRGDIQQRCRSGGGKG